MNSPYLEVAIGVIVVFFVVATVADGVNEVITRALNTRAKALWATIQGLLETEVAKRPHVGTDFVVKSAAPSFLLKHLDVDFDYRPVVGQLASDTAGQLKKALNEDLAPILERRIMALPKDERDLLLGRIRGMVDSGSRDLDRFGKKLQKRLTELNYSDVLEVAKAVGLDGDLHRLYPPLQTDRVRRLLSLRYRLDNELPRSLIASWVVDQDTSAALLAATVPLTATRRTNLGQPADGSPVEVYRNALADRSIDEQEELVTELIVGDDAIELARRWAKATGVAPIDAEPLAAWLLTLSVGRQLDLLRRATATGQTVDAATRAAHLFSMASIEGLDYVRQSGRRTKVSWVDGEAFASAIWEAARRYEPDIDAGPLEAGSAARVKMIADEWSGTPLGDYLHSVGVDSAENVDHFVESVGGWFDGQMERLSMTYRRNVRWVLGVVGLVLAFGANVNAVALADALIDDSEARQTLVGYSDLLVAKCEPDETGMVTIPDPTKDGAETIEVSQAVCVERVETSLDNVTELDELGIPLVSSAWTMPPLLSSDQYVHPVFGNSNADRLAHLVGIAITAIAVSYGGAFWFDFLKLLTGVRRKR